MLCSTPTLQKMFPHNPIQYNQQFVWGVEALTNDLKTEERNPTIKQASKRANKHTFEHSVLWNSATGANRVFPHLSMGSDSRTSMMQSQKSNVYRFVSIYVEFSWYKHCSILVVFSCGLTGLPHPIWYLYILHMCSIRFFWFESLGGIQKEMIAPLHRLHHFEDGNPVQYWVDTN